MEEKKEDFEVVKILCKTELPFGTLVLRKITRMVSKRNEEGVKRNFYQVALIKDNREVIKRETYNYDYALNYYNIQEGLNK